MHSRLSTGVIVFGVLACGSPPSKAPSAGAPPSVETQIPAPGSDSDRHEERDLRDLLGSPTPQAPVVPAAALYRDYKQYLHKGVIVSGRVAGVFPARVGNVAAFVSLDDGHVLAYFGADDWRALPTPIQKYQTVSLTCVVDDMADSHLMLTGCDTNE